MESLEQLHVSYRRSLEDKRRQLRVSWDVLCGEDVSDMQVRDMHRRLHQLCGSAGAYGFQDICDTARMLEKRWVQWLANAPSDRVATYVLCSTVAPDMMHLLDLLEDAARES